MVKKRLRLIAARIESGFLKQDELVTLLKKKGFEITVETYRNIENGRSKNVDINLAFAIAEELNKDVKEIFLDQSA